jgi:protease-4
MWFKKAKPIAWIPVDGMITDASVQTVLDWLKTVRKKRFKAVIVRVNSPGGTVGASQELFEALEALRAEGIKVVASLADVAASGGLYIAMASDAVVSQPGTVTGSIGVIIRSGNLQRLLEKVGVGSNVIKSGPFKDILSPERAMTAEEQALLQDVVNSTYEQFVGAVAQGRNLSVTDVKTFADGRIFTGQQAKAYGLVDELGGRHTAERVARRLAHLPADAQVHDFEGKKPLLRKLMSHLDLPAAATPLWLYPG